jgi:hypothetical protein
MKMPRCSVSHFVVSLVAFTAFLHVGHAFAKGGKSQDTVGRVVEINKQALAQLQAAKYDQARDALWNAIAVLTDANMADHEISARTHVHLAAVYMTGFNERNKAIKQFVMALKINPNIKITPQVETAALDEAFDAARTQLSMGPSGRTGAAPTPTPTPVVADATPDSESVGKRAHGKKVVDEPEPLPPSKVTVPLYCPMPNEVPPKQDLIVRCVTQKKPKLASATLFYREGEDFTPLPMVRSARGWLTATVPGSAVAPPAFQFYVTAKVPGAKEPLEMGNADGPNLMPVIDGAAPMNNAGLAALLRGEGASARTEAVATEDKAPLDEINEQYQKDEDLRKYHRRYVGSFFVSLGGGAFSAITYHGNLKADGSFASPLTFRSGTNPASMFQAVPEIGYVINEKLAMSLQVRYQYAPYVATGQVNVAPPPTSALAFFLRAQYNFLTLANFQMFVSGAVGGGQRTFLAYMPRSCNSSDYSELSRPAWCKVGTNDHSNVASAGPGAGALGIGILYHLTRWLGFYIEGRGMASVAPIMLLAEGNAGFSFSYKFEKSAPPPPKEEGPGGWEKPPGEDGPPADAPPSD